MGNATELVSASAMAAEQQTSGSWLGVFGSITLAVFQLLSSILYWALRVTTFSVPSLLFTIFSTSLTVTMNATTLMVIMGMAFSLASWFVRYRYLNMYARLPPEPQRKEPELDLFVDPHSERDKSGLSNYLDEFLSAIKIFGYLERPVFHELTRSMQTRKLIAGETFNLEEEKGFCMVVDGLVEIFVKSGDRRPAPAAGSPISESSGDEQEEYHSGHQRYQLLTEVHNGAPMSSLFSIMSLFTEDVKLRHNEDESEPPSATELYQNTGLGLSDNFRNQHDLPISVPNTPQIPRSGAEGTPQESQPLSHSTSNIPPISLDPPLKQRPKRPVPKRNATTSAHPDIIARATKDTTIAIIPASAFRRLIRIYPKYTSHIVHVILSRFQRVTLATAYNYLGLTRDVLQIEKSMIEYTTCELPNFLRGDALDRLKEKFVKERERMGDGDCTKGIALHNSSSGRRHSASASLRKEAALQALSNRQRHSSVMASQPNASLPRGPMSTSGSGTDLLNNIKLSRNGGHPSTANMDAPSASTPTVLLEAEAVSPLSQRVSNPFVAQRHARISMNKRETVDEDGIFRESILECMFKAIGLTTNTSGTSESTEGSPLLGSYDQIRQRGVSSHNAFGLIDPYGGSADGDADSITSGGTGLPNQAVNTRALAHDMRDEVEIVYFPKGSLLVEQGERNPGLYYVVDGFLDVCMTSDESSGDILQVSRNASSSSPARSSAARRSSSDRRKASTSHHSMPASGMKFVDGRRGRKGSRRSVALVKPGNLAGYVGTISSHRSFIDVVAKTDVYVGFLSRQSLERIVDRYPIVLLTIAKRLTNLLPRLILHIDFALEWLQVNAGEVLFHGGEESEAIHIVLNGRLRLVGDRKDGGVDVRAEYGQGESIGELEVLTESARTGTLHAIRNTELVKFPRTLFNSLAQEHPNITIKISKIIASRMRSIVNDPSSVVGKESAMKATLNKGSSTLNLRTVAILPVTAGVPVVEFGSRLMAALTQVGTPNGATSLTQSAILNHLGRHAFNKMGNLKLSQYLADLEEKYGLVIYVADTNVNSPWTQTCITQADCILLVGLAEGSPEVGEYERFMLGMKSTARKTLVLLHAERYSSPGLTRAWLKNRMWINGGHHHVQMAFQGQTVPMPKRTGPSLKERVQIIQAEIQKYTSRKVRHTPFYSPDAPYKGDFHRLARRLCGKSVGLVLGGGGARGIAQVGIIRAMEESGIPIDIVGGTSIGSFVGALYARHADVVPIFGLSKKFSGRMASMWRFALDLTYPSASYTTGHEFNRGIYKTFGKTQIEDFWLEFYCNTTNISKSRAEIHTSGYAWRYVRASMSLAGLLPPLCDEGSMLLDGGYIDNLTVSHMRSLGVETIFAVDVGSLDDDVPQAYGDTLSGLWAFVNRWNPFSNTPNPPTLAEIQARLAYVSSVDALERAKTTPGCIYMRPPIDEYGTLDFGKFDEIVHVGYQYGREFLQKLREEGVLPLIEETEAKKALRRTMAPRRASI
ncbi:lysophospholipase NTE1 [Gaeumannomyces tritici R3-111a-1]|uniref:Lysophospholipase NTE1 n=1 Tax=Gaeumannomyces tritici (strain R3-111a-1) TaxID=644352 RepID=J3P4D4_GAET3|nr:lysophospholipase NTE1 [Gaeumannomyces tritici R3-111a-1]EJT74530.1 lysophospholipase NTE1 [Gaeumannomyces tritici R3-111a-1]